MFVAPQIRGPPPLPSLHLYVAQTRQTKEKCPTNRPRRLSLAVSSSMAPNEDEDVVGVIVVDHGSRNPSSNEQLEKFAERYAAKTFFASEEEVEEGHQKYLVEPAHMELARPSISDAFEKLTSRGAKTIVVAPFFLSSSGRHVTEDIPKLVEEARKEAKGEIERVMISEPVGSHPLMEQIVNDRVEQAFEAIVNTDRQVEN